MPNLRASRTTSVNLSQDREILSGQTFTIFCIVVANSAGFPAEVHIRDASENNPLKITVTVPPADSKILYCEVVADRGINIHGLNSADVFVTLFHSNPGS